MTEPRITPKTYLLAYLALLALTLANTLIAFVDLGVFSTVIAIAIATIMAMLVAGFLMHALFEFKVIRIILAGGVIWFLINIFGILDDYVTRGFVRPGK
jgi:cytochrome c oxidase subunit 4